MRRYTKQEKKLILDVRKPVKEVARVLGRSEATIAQYRYQARRSGTTGLQPVQRAVPTSSAPLAHEEAFLRAGRDYTIAVNTYIRDEIARQVKAN